MLKKSFRFFKIICLILILSFMFFVNSSLANEDVIETENGNFYIGNTLEEVSNNGYKLENTNNSISLFSNDIRSSNQTYNVTNTITATTQNGVLTFSGTGKLPDYDNSNNVPWGGDTSITKIVIGNGITSIGKYNFVNLSSLKEVSLPNTITSIGEGAFYGCSSLTSFNIPSKVTEISNGAFAECYLLENITLNEGLKTIGDYAFQNTAIKEITIPSTVTKIGTAFTLGVQDITEYKVASGNKIFFTEGGALCEDDPAYTNTYIKAYPIANTADTYEIPERVNDIDQQAFSGAKYLKKIIVHDKVEAIRAYAFSDCESLEEVIIGRCDLFFFGPSVFENCSKLKTVEFGAILTNTYYPVDELQYHTFGNCTSLETVNFTGEVGIIYDNAFENCTSLKTITLSKTTRQIDKNAFLNCTSLEKVIWSDTIEAVHKDAFNGCTKLTEKYPSDFELSTNDYYREKNIDIYLTGTYYYSWAKEVLNLVNQERAKQGLSSVYMDTALFDTANQRAAECAVLWDHTRPDGTDCFDIFPSGNSRLAENIAVNQRSAQDVMNSWMNSSVHRANMLDPNLKSIGISCFYHAGIYYWVQCFGNTGTNKTSYPSDGAKQVTVEVPASKITFSVDSQNLEVKANSSSQPKIFATHVDSVYYRCVCDSNTFDIESLNTNLFTINGNGKIVTKRNLGTGKINVTAPNSQKFTLTVNVILPYTDIKNNVWYTNALEYMFTNNYISGTTESTFSPNMELSRAMLVCILWNMEGKPKTTAINKFPDVKNGVWYTDAIKWASSKGVINGYKDGTFGPNDSITREQLACILANYAKYKKCYTKPTTNNLGKFLDNNMISAWAVESVNWAVTNRVINGAENGTKINPINSASRAEAITMVKNYIDRIK